MPSSPTLFACHCHAFSSGGVPDTPFESLEAVIPPLLPAPRSSGRQMGECVFPAGSFWGCLDASSRRHCRGGVMEFNSGNTYWGPWISGSPSTALGEEGRPLGVKWFRGGDVYVGGWVGGRREGFGIYTFATGSWPAPRCDVDSHSHDDEVERGSRPRINAQFRGFYSNDQPNGEGILITYDSNSKVPDDPPNAIGIKSVYRGLFVNGLREGAGRQTTYNPQTGNVVSDKGKRILQSGRRAESTVLPKPSPEGGLPATFLERASQPQLDAVVASLDAMSMRMQRLESRLGTAAADPARIGATPPGTMR